MVAFDADVLIYAAAPRHPWGQRVAAALASNDVRVGSVLLLPEVLSKALRDHDAEHAEVGSLLAVLARLELLPVDRSTAELATHLAASYRLRATDAVHLATAVAAGADRFLTNNQRDFASTIREVQVTYPADLPSA